MDLSPGKLSAKTVWLFALAAVLLGVGSGFVTAPLGTKISSAVFFGIFAVAGFLAIYFSDAKQGVGYLAFVLAALLTGVIYYFVVSRVMIAATETAATAASLGQADQGQVAEVSGVFGGVFGVFAGVITFLSTLVAGLGGCFAGRKFKAAGGFDATRTRA